MEREIINKFIFRFSEYEKEEASLNIICVVRPTLDNLLDILCNDALDSFSAPNDLPISRRPQNARNAFCPFKLSVSIEFGVMLL